jgi:hexosaminidase
VLALTLAFLAAQTVALWPIPRSLQTGSTSLILSKNFKITNLHNPPSDLDAAVSRTLGHLSGDKLQRLVVGRASADQNVVQNAKQLSSLVLSIPAGTKVNSISAEAILPLGSRSEEYTLHVPSDGSAATLSANSTLGLLRGLTTFEQLWYDLNGAATYTLEAPISITDAPAFVSVVITFWCPMMLMLPQPYRGFMLDTARNL